MERSARSAFSALVLLLVVLSPAAMAAQPATSTSTGTAIAGAPDRQALVGEILGLWGSAPNPVNSRNEARYPDLHAALNAATVEQLVDGQRARTLDDLWAALPKDARSPLAATPLAAGRIPQVISLGNDLVYTPVTPCRIVDTRGGVAPYTGILGPNSGNWFNVALTDYSPQGGFAGSCGIPSVPYPAAVAINVTSTGQSGNGNLRVIQSGGGLPNTSLLNYVASVNIANAAIVPVGSGAIYIYSANSQSHAVVDILGYFSVPFAKLPDNEILDTSADFAASTTFDVYSPGCDLGYRLVGGGFNSLWYNGIANITSSRPVQGMNSNILTGLNTGDRWLCQGITNVATTIHCSAICARVPGTVILY